MMSLSGTIRLNYSRGRRVTDSVAGAERRPLLYVLTTFYTHTTTPTSGPSSYQACLLICKVFCS